MCVCTHLYVCTCARVQRGAGSSLRVLARVCAALSRISELAVLQLAKCELSVLPSELISYRPLVVLNLARNQLTELPNAFCRGAHSL